MTRTVTIGAGSAVTGTDCGGAAADPCFAYTGTIHDAGTAHASAGQVSPGAQAVPIAGTPAAAMTGDAVYAFDASSSSPDATLVPAVTSGNAVSTTNWAEQFFPAGTKFGGANLASWKWTYTDAKDCQQWVDELNGSAATSGDITGADDCNTSISAPASATVVVGTPAHIQVTGSTTSSDKALTFSAVGLPDGLTIDSATGLISGTPAADAASHTATVTVKDFSGVAAVAHIAIGVQAAPAQQPVLSNGKATSVSPTREVVSWTVTPAADTSATVTITGPGFDHVSSHVTKTQATYTGLTAAHTYTVTIQDDAGGTPGKVVFVTAAH